MIVRTSGSVEYFVVLCVVITICSDAVSADLDCRRFVFAPSCRGVNAKRDSFKTHDNHGQTNEDMINERPEIASESEATELEVRTHSNGLPKRFLHLPRVNKDRFNELRRYNLMKHLEEVIRSSESEYD